MKELYESIRDLNPNAKNVLITGIDGSLLGEKLLLSDGKIIFSTSDGLAAYSSKFKILENGGKLEVDGKAVFGEILGAEKKLVICGGGHVSMPIITMGKMIGLYVTVLEDRPLFADHARCAGADKVICEDFAKGLDSIEGDNDTYFVIVTRGHRYDMVCLEKIVPKPNAYIGMIGSKLRVKNVLEAVEETLSVYPDYQGDNLNLLKKSMKKIYTPIGLKIYAETPEEIAISIMAEIISVKNGAAQTNAYTKQLLKGILEEEKKDMGKVLATIISRKGSAPRGVGTKMVYFQDGSTIGTIGGGCAEADIQRKSILLMNEKKSKVYKVDMTGKEAEDDGMVCGGVIEVLLEPFH
ncbi:MAG: XdhC family protein [Velocimicrobium sp.]